MFHFYQSAFMEALGWSLVDSFWKTGSLWLLYVIITGNGQWLGATARYFFAVVLLMAGTIWSATGIFGYYQDISSGKDLSSLSVYLNLHIGGMLSAAWLMPWISTVYICLVVLLCSRMVVQYLFLKQQSIKYVSSPDERVCEIFADLKEKMGISTTIALYFSHLVSTPVTTGFLRPLILLPVAVLNSLTIEQTASLIAHELSHIRRNDYLLNLLVSVAGTVLFFNPFARLFRDVIRKERENACDDEVMALGIDHWQYAHALYTLGRYDADPVSFAMPLTGDKRFLLERVRRILPAATPKISRQRRAGSIIRCGLLFFLCLASSVFVKKNSPLMPSAVPVPTIAVNISSNKFLKQVNEVTDAGPSQTKPTKAKIYQKKVVRKSIADRASGAQDLVKTPDLPQLPAAPDAPPVVNSFVSLTHEAPAFTLTVPEDQEVVPDVKIELNTLVPYVPSSTFYFSNVEKSRNEKGLRTVHL